MSSTHKSIKIPDEGIKTLMAINQFDDAQIKILLETIENSETYSQCGKYASYLSEKAKLDKKMVHDILHTLRSIYELSKDFKNSLDEMKKEFLDALILKKQKTQEISDINENKVVDFIFEGIKLKNISLLSKIAGIVSSYHNVYIDRSFKILTDIRPIFVDDDVGNPISVDDSVIIHTIKFDYAQNNTLKTFYLSLDQEDLLNLELIINRAKTKEILLKDKCKQSNLSIIDRKR